MPVTLVSSVTVGSGGASSIEFTNIPATGTDLLVRLSSRGTSADFDQSIDFRWNSLSSGYSGVYLRSYNGGTTTSSSSGTNEVGIRIPSSTSVSNTFGDTSIYLSNYTSSLAKSVSIEYATENNTNANSRAIIGARNTGTAAISSVSFIGNFAQHSTASLYIIS